MKPPGKRRPGQSSDGEQDIKKQHLPSLTSLVFAGLLASGYAAAHHSFAAGYDENAPLNMQGVVTKVELTNPHSWLWVDVTNEDGTVTNWGFEGGPPVNLFRNGLTRDTLPVGSEIKVFAYQAKSGENKGVAVFFEYLDGSKIFMGGSAPGADGQPRPQRNP